MTTTEEMLTQINEAITAIETGAQEYQYSNRSVKKADLAILYKERQALRVAYSQDQQELSTFFGQTGLASFFPR